MRPYLCILGVVLITSLNAAFGQSLSAKEIVEKINGHWAIPFEVDGNRVVDCNQLSNRISVVQRDGSLFLKQVHLGAQINEAYDTPLAKIKPSFEDIPVPHIIIKYQSASTINPQDQPDYWRLFMFGNDQFAWQSSDWSGAQITGVRRRCEADSVS